MGLLPVKAAEVLLSYTGPDIEETIFKQIMTMTRIGPRMEEPIRQFENPAPFYSAISTLRDGTLISPVEFLRPIGQAAL